MQRPVSVEVARYWPPLFRLAQTGLEDYFRVAPHPSRVDAKCGDHFLQADFLGPELLAGLLVNAKTMVAGGAVCRAG
jgi:hypothetical protein